MKSQPLDGYAVPAWLCAALLCCNAWSAEPKNPPAELLGPGAAPKRPVEAGACAPLKLNADVGGLDTAAGAPGAPPPPPPKEKAPLGAGAGAPNEKFDMAVG